MKKTFLLLGSIFAGAAICAAEVDDHTLYYCSFDEKLEADVSAGVPIIHGHASLTEDEGGKKGEALIMKYAECISPAEIQGMYRHLRVTSKDNINKKIGTLEMWVKMGDQAAVQPGSNSSSLFNVGYTYAGWGQKEEWAFLRINRLPRRKTGEWQIQFQVNDKDSRRKYSGQDWMKNDARAEILKYDIGSWVADKKWHHVAVTWEGKKIQMFIDGKLVDSKETRFDGLTTTDPTEIYLAGNFGVGNMALPCFIDELQISDIVRYKANFNPEGEE